MIWEIWIEQANTWRFFQVKDFVPSHVPNMFLIMFPFFFHFFLLVLKYSSIYPILFVTCSLCCSHSSHVVVKFIPCALSNVPYFVHMVSMPLILSHILCPKSSNYILHWWVKWKAYISSMLNMFNIWSLFFLWWANLWSLSLEEVIWIFYDSQ
jgi:hypothetical protein